jgi:hypothetical protein
MNKAIAILFVLGVVLSGCGSNKMAGPEADCYYLNPDKHLSGVGRVAIIELENHSSYPEVAADATEAIFQALQKKQVFSVKILRHDDPVWRGQEPDLNSTYRLEELSEIRKATKCNAILVGTITEFEPHPHMTIGLRLKLLDLKDGQLLWAFEQIWDTADKTTEDRIRRYFRSQTHSDRSPSKTHLLAASPIRFIKFVAFEVGQTFPAYKPKHNGLAGAGPRN